MASCACVGLEFAASAVLGGSRNDQLMGQKMANGLGISVNQKRRVGPMGVTARTGGVPYRPPRISTGPRRGPNQQQNPDRDDGPLMNTDIRSATSTLPFAIRMSIFF
jgi:hypothetical protein